jgi:cyclin-dependent kinase-like
MNHKYQVIEIIGEGAYGTVYKCKNTETNEIVAIKKFLDKYEKLPKNKVINREIFLLQISKHENIVKFIEAFIKKGYLFLVFDYVEKNLLQLI